jgi:glycosyltransferase involved in cell wall biosynthesis
MRGQFKYFDKLFNGYTMKRKMIKLLQETEELTVAFCVDPVFITYYISQLKDSFSHLRVITSLRGTHLDLNLIRFPLFSKSLIRQERISIEKSDMILANGWDTKKNYDEKYSIDCRIQKNGVDYEQVNRTSELEAVEIPSGTNSIVSVATLIPSKGVYKLVDVGAAYKELYGSDFTIYYVGKGDQQPLYDYAEKKGIDNNIKCLGHKNNPIAYMKKGKVNIGISGSSGLSHSMIEALAAGVPIVAIDTPVYRQFNQGNKLLLADESDPREMAMMIHEVLTNYDKYCMLAKELQEVAKQFDWSIVVADLERYLEEIANM